MDIKSLAQCLVVIKLYSEDLTVFLLGNSDPSYFAAYVVHSTMFCYFLNYQRG